MATLLSNCSVVEHRAVNPFFVVRRHIWSRRFATNAGGLLSKGFLLLRDNACPHSVAANVEAIKQLKFGLLPHLPYRPDLAPSDYHIFEPLKEALRGRRFASDDEVKDAVHTWLRSQQITFFAVGIRKLVTCYTICVEKRGNYVEKWYILHLSQIFVYEVINISFKT